MASEDVIELGSSEDEAEPAPKKRKPMPNAMVVIPNKFPGITIKPAQPNLLRKDKKTILSKPNINNKSVYNMNSYINKKKQVTGPIQFPFKNFTKVQKTPLPIHNRCINPLNLAKNAIGPQVPVPKQIKVLKNLTEVKGPKKIHKLPEDITIKLVQNVGASEINKCKSGPPQSSVDVLTVEIDDEEIAETSSPQWYIRPEEQIDEIDKKEDITGDNEHDIKPSMEKENNREPERSEYVEITIEDSPIKPLQQKQDSEIGKELAITIEGVTQNSKNVDSDNESNRKVTHSKKKLVYPKETESSERQVVEIEIDLMDTGNSAINSNNINKDQQDSREIRNSTVRSTNINNDSLTKNKETTETKESVDGASHSEFHPVYQNFIDMCFKLENSEDMKKIVEKKIKAYYKQCPKEYVESEDFLDMVSNKIVSMKAGPEKMYLYIKDIVDELNLQRKMAKSTILSIEGDPSQDTSKTSPVQHEYDSRKRKQIRKLEKTIKKLHRAIQKLEVQEVEFDDDEDSVYLLTERYKERLARVHKKFCQVTKTKMPSEARIHIESRPGHPTGPAKRLEKWVNKKIPIGAPLPFPDFHDVLHCVRAANVEDRLGWTEHVIMEEARDLFTRCGKKLQRRRQENEWRLAVSRIPQDVDPAEESAELKKRLDENKTLAIAREADLLNKFADKQNQLKLEAVEIDDKEAEESPVESEEDEEEVVESNNSAEDKQKRKDKLKQLLKEKSKNTDVKENEITPVNETENKIEDKGVDDVEKVTEDTTKDDTENTESNSELHYVNLETETVTKNTDEVKQIPETSERMQTESDNDRVESDVDELHLYQKSRKIRSKHEDNSSLESSDSDSPISISDTSEFESEVENDKKISDIISIENSSYSESEFTCDYFPTDAPRNLENVVNAKFEVEYACATVVEESLEKDGNVDLIEDVLLASTDEEDTSKDVGVDIYETCINLKDDNISITETTVCGESLEQDDIMNKEENLTPENNNQFKIIHENSTNSDDKMVIQDCSEEDENDSLKNMSMQTTNEEAGS